MIIHLQRSSNHHFFVSVLFQRQVKPEASEAQWAAHVNPGTQRCKRSNIYTSGA